MYAREIIFPLPPCGDYLPLLAIQDGRLGEMFPSVWIGRAGGVLSRFSSATSIRMRVGMDKTLTEQSGSDLIAAERERQEVGERWTESHDDEHSQRELVRAACCYASEAHMSRTQSHMTLPPIEWPWEPEWWKPSGNAIRDLTKAGALIAAEIDRLQRERRS